MVGIIRTAETRGWVTVTQLVLRVCYMSKATRTASLPFFIQTNLTCHPLAFGLRHTAANDTLAHEGRHRVRGAVAVAGGWPLRGD